MLNYLHFGKEKVIKSKVQPGDTDTSYSSAPTQLHPTSLSKLSDFTVKLHFLTLQRALETQKIEF